MLFARIACLAGIIAFASSAQAQVNVSVNPAEGGQFAQAFGANLAQLESELQGQLEEAFNVLRPGEYLKALADASSFSSRGLGADHATNPRTFSLGLAANLTVAMGDDGFDELENEKPVAGVAPNLAITVGINLGKLLSNPSLNRWMLYVNGFTYGGAIEQFDGNVTSYGGHLTYQLVEPTQGKASAALQWGGLQLGGGVDFAKSRITLEGELESEFELEDLQVNGQSAQVNMLSTGTFSLKTNTLTFPLEATTSLRFLYVLSLYGGVGIDFISGESEMDVDINGTMTGTVPGDATPIPLGDANVNVVSQSSPSAGSMRFLAGLQLNLWRLRVFAQANVRPDSALGVALGARMAW